MLTRQFESIFEREKLREEDIWGYEQYLWQTPTQSLAITESSYRIDTNNSTANEFDDLQEAMLQVKFKIVRDDNGNAIHADNKASLTHGVAGLFANMRLLANGQEVDRCIDCANTNNILQKCGLSVEKFNEVAQSEFYYPAGVLGAIGTAPDPPLATVDDPCFELGHARTAASAEVWASLPLKRLLKFCDTGRIYKGIDWTLLVDKNAATGEYILRPAAGGNIVAVKPHIMELRLLLPRIKVSPIFANRFNDWIAAGKDLFVDYHKTHYVRLDPGVGNTQYSLNIGAGMKKPRYLFVAPVLQSAVNNQEANGSIYTTGVLAGPVAITTSMIYVMVNGKQSPMFAYTGIANGYLREFLATKTAFGKHKQDLDSNLVKLSLFHDYHQIYVFDLSHQDDAWENNTHNDVTIRLQFNHTQTAAMVFHCLIVGDQSYRLQPIGGKLAISAEY